MNIQVASREDIPALCALLAVLFSQEVEFAPNLAKQSSGLEAIIADPRIGLILVAREGAQIVGMVNMLFTVSTCLGGKVVLLEDMIVHPDYRAMGIGTKLLEAVIERAANANCARVTLLTDAANAEAKAFYRRAGFLESTMTPMRLLLPQRG